MRNSCCDGIIHFFRRRSGMRKAAELKGLGLFAVLTVLVVGTWGTVVFAGGNPHVAEAIAHAEGAAKHGGMGHADAL
ncbi:MAG: hypothetical protein KC643_09490, partial [Nitrospira sp.]|nr:hypothetical protein [Nitrospira sp.]